MSAPSISSLSIELLYATSYRHNIWRPLLPLLVQKQWNHEHWTGSRALKLWQWPRDRCSENHQWNTP